MSITAIDTIAVAPINCAQLSLFLALRLNRSIVSTWHLRLLVAIDPLVVVSAKRLRMARMEIVGGCFVGPPCTKPHKIEINICAGLASKKPWFYSLYGGSRGQSPSLKASSHFGLKCHHTSYQRGGIALSDHARSGSTLAPAGDRNSYRPLRDVTDAERPSSPSPSKAQSDDRSMQDQVEVVFVCAAVLTVVDSQRAIADETVKARLPEVEPVSGK